MDYNTSRDKLVIREYGRNIQSLIDYAVAIEDDEKRNEVSLYIIELMGQMNPHLRNVEEFKRKLWDHLFVISKFKLDVKSPYPIPTKEEIDNIFKHDKLPYPKKKIQFKHYGKNVENMVKKAVEMEDPEMKKAYSEVIGNYMKLVYNNWNRENITDEVIKNDFNSLSNGELKIDEETSLDTLTKSNRKKKRPTNKTGSNSSNSYRKNNKRKR